MKLVFSILIFFAVGILNGQTVTKKEAAHIAETFIQHNFISKSKYSVKDTLVFQKKGVVVSYGFNVNPDGFIIVSTSTKLDFPVLGYSEHGMLNLSSLPANMNWWLDQVSDKIYQLIINSSNGYESSKLISGSQKKGLKSTTAVAPLCTTLWDQGCFFNSDCPQDNFGPCGHCVTGCVATAMAQIMKYWNYPQYGHGTHSYVHNQYGVLSADFGATHYDWSNMPDSLSMAAPPVATLMSHCGIAVDMNYSSTSSGSYIRAAPFTQFFRYSLNARNVMALNYSANDWIDLLKNELDQGRPILYSGMPAPPLPEGHAWVIDGYDNNDYFHFNWGWSGNSNGFFQMGNFVFSLSNEAVIGIMPVQNADITVKELINPVTSSFVGPEPVRVKVANYDSVPHFNIPMRYQSDNGVWVNDIMTDTLFPFSEKIFEFSQPINLSGQPGHIYQVRVVCDLAGDMYRGNDTLITYVEDVICAVPPYQMGFEPGESKAGWKIVDGNDDTYTWYYGSQGGHSGPYCAYMIPGSPQADDWLISKCISLQSGILYKLSFWHISGNPLAVQDFKVYMGHSGQISAMTNLLTDINHNTATGYQKSETWFTVPASGSYYFGWYYHGTNAMTSPVIDDISIEPMMAPDAGIHHTISPSDGCDLNMEPVVVNVKNYGSSIIQNINMGYSVDGGPIQFEPLTGPILVGGNVDFTFSVLADVSMAGIHSIHVFTDMMNDTLHVNDSVTYYITNHHSPQFPYGMGFETNEDFSEWIVENTNGDNYTWMLQANGGHFGPQCYRYDYSSWIPANDWLFTKCLHLSAEKTYKLGFWNKIEDQAWPENMSVSIGFHPNSNSMTSLIMDLPGLTNTSWLHSQAYFSVPVTGYYYLGWKCYSDALMFNLYLDDILLEEYATSIVPINISDDVFVYPNPGNGLFSIILPESYQVNTIEIYSSVGSLIQKVENLSSGRFDLNLTRKADGIYLMKIRMGEKTKMVRLIKASE